jgi:hypothetical protein
LFKPGGSGGLGGPGGGAPTGQQGAIGGGNQFSSFVGGVNRFAAMGGSNFGGGLQQAFNTGGGGMMSIGGRGGAGGINIGGAGGNRTSWSTAAQRSVPDVNAQGGARSTFANLAFNGGGGGGGGSRGPLDANNWQSNRTSSLVVRNVPGANMFMTANGMG